MSDMVITQVVEQLQTLPDNLQRQVLAYVGSLQKNLRFGVPGRQLLRFKGIIPADDLQLMQEAIEKDCEQVDWDAW